MFKLARALTLVAMLGAINLAGMTAVAQVQTTDQPSRQADATVRRLLARERSSIPDAAHPRLLLDEDRSTLLNLPTARPPSRPARPGPLPSPAGRLAGSPRRWVPWPPSWRWSPGSPCWPLGAPTVANAPTRRPEDIGPPDCPLLWIIVSDEPERVPDRSTGRAYSEVSRRNGRGRPSGSTAIRYSAWAQRALRAAASST